MSNAGLSIFLSPPPPPPSGPPPHCLWLVADAFPNQERWSFATMGDHVVDLAQARRRLDQHDDPLQAATHAGQDARAGRRHEQDEATGARSPRAPTPRGNQRPLPASLSPLARAAERVPQPQVSGVKDAGVVRLTEIGTASTGIRSEMLLLPLLLLLPHTQLGPSSSSLPAGQPAGRRRPGSNRQRPGPAGRLGQRGDLGHLSLSVSRR